MLWIACVLADCQGRLREQLGRFIFSLVMQQRSAFAVQRRGSTLKPSPLLSATIKASFWLGCVLHTPCRSRSAP